MEGPEEGVGKGNVSVHKGSSRGVNIFNLLVDSSSGQTPWLYHLAGLETLIKEEI